MEAGKRGRRFLASLTRWDGRGGFSLEPIQRVLASLDNPQDKVPIIHVAGTNGKGSTSVMLSAIFGQEGKRVGLTISPHLNQVNERIVIDGLPVSDDLFEVSADAIRWGCEKTGESLSYHEALTAMAFFAFCEEGVELSVIEVGLGGRLDASNVIKKPLVSVITSIGLDHTDILGSSEEAIAAEKAGIIKPGSHVVVGARVSNEAFGVISNNAIGVGSSIDRFGVEFSSILTEKGEGLYSGPSSKGIVFRPSLSGEHQIENGALALRVGEYLGVSVERGASSLESVFWPARLEFVEYKDRPFLLDCAHNVDGVRALRSFLDSVERPKSIVFGALDTKNWRGGIDLLFSAAQEWILIEPLSDRAVPSGEVADYLSGLGISSRITTVDKYINNINMLNNNYLNLITGSMYLVGALRGHLVQNDRALWHRSLTPQ